MSNSLFVITGDDEYAIDQKAREIVDQTCPQEEQALGLETIAGDVGLVEDAVAVLQKVLGAIQTVGFFGGKKTVWLRDARMFSASLPGTSEEVKKVVEVLKDLVRAGLPEGHVLVVSGQKFDKRSAFMKAAKDKGEIVEFKLPEKEKEADQAAKDRVSEAWKSLGLKPAGSNVMALFVQVVGGDTRRLIQETEKLATYKGAEDRTVTMDDIRAVVSPGRESISWALADHVGHRKLGPALQVYRQLLFQRENPVGLIFGLESRFRELLILKECQQRKWVRVEGSERYRKAVWNVDAEGEEWLAGLPRDPRKVHPYRTLLLLEQAAKYTLKELVLIQRQLAETHLQLVSSSLPPELALELMLIRIVGRPAVKR